MTIKYAISTVFVLLLTIGACSCSTKKAKEDSDAKKAPEYVGVPMNLEPYVNEFMELSKQYNLTFKKTVTIGIKEINRGRTIGLCTYGKDWREIDIDVDFYFAASEKRKKALVFHELIHCYCTRGHDFGKDKNYAESALTRLVQRVQEIPWCLVRTPPGYLDDYCPATIMHPEIIDDTCLGKHWPYYMKEMFDRCEPF